MASVTHTISEKLTKGVIFSKAFPIRLLVCFIGILFMSSRASIFYLLNMGSDPYQVLATALHRTLSVSYGTANIILNSLIIGIILLFKRSYVNIALFLNWGISGSVMDICNTLLSGIITPKLPIPIKLLLIMLGCVMLAFGIYLYTSPKLGASPADSLGFIVSDVFHISYGKVRIYNDIIYTVLGLLLSGTIGIATIFAIFLTGPIIGFLHKLLDNTKIMKYIYACSVYQQNN